MTAHCEGGGRGEGEREKGERGERDGGREGERKREGEEVNRESEREGERGRKRGREIEMESVFCMYHYLQVHILDIGVGHTDIRVGRPQLVYISW